MRGASSGGLRRLLRWSPWLAVGLVSGLVIGFVLGLVEPRARTS